MSLQRKDEKIKPTPAEIALKSTPFNECAKQFEEDVLETQKRIEEKMVAKEKTQPQGSNNDQQSIADETSAFLQEADPSDID